MRKAMFLTTIFIVLTVLLGSKNVFNYNADCVKTYVVDSVEELTEISGNCLYVDFFDEVDVSKYDEEYFLNQSLVLLVFEHVQEQGTYLINDTNINNTFLEYDIYVEHPIRGTLALDNMYFVTELGFVAGEEYFVKVS